jgi:acyl carrier protein
MRNIQGFDTAGFVRLILALESEFGVVLREDEVDSIDTMGDVFAILRAKSTDGG